MLQTRSLIQLRRVPKVTPTLYKISRIHRSFSSQSTDIKPHDHVVSEEEVAKVNEQYRGTIKIKDTQYGRGVFTLRDFERGNFVVSLKIMFNFVVPVLDRCRPFFRHKRMEGLS